MRTVDDAHRDAALTLALTIQDREFALLNDDDTNSHDESIAAAEFRVTALTKVAPPPADVAEFVAAELEKREGNIQDEADKWDLYNDDPALATLIFAAEVDPKRVAKEREFNKKRLEALGKAKAPKAPKEKK